MAHSVHDGEQDPQHSDPTPCPVEPGDVIGGYSVDRLLAIGGTAAIFSASSREAGERVAIKVLLADTKGDPDGVARFFREAGTVARMRTEHVARVLDVGKLDGGMPYIVFEHLDGEDLGDLLAARGRLDVEEAVDCVMQACDAMAEAHALGIVHHDLKPENLFLARSPAGHSSIKVIDFGISRAVRASAAEPAAPHGRTLVGSPMYMSPEQVMGSPADPRSDVWSLGVVLYELIAGRPPFLGETVAEVFGAVLGDPAPPLAELCPEVPSGLAAVVHRCLDRSPADRFSGAAELSRALAPFARAATVVDVAPPIPLVARAQLASLPSVPPVAATIPPPGPAWSRRITVALAPVAAIAAVTLAWPERVGQLEPCAPAVARVQAFAASLRETLEAARRAEEARASARAAEQRLETRGKGRRRKPGAASSGRTPLSRRD